MTRKVFSGVQLLPYHAIGAVTVAVGLTLLLNSQLHFASMLLFFIGLGSGLLAAVLSKQEAQHRQALLEAEIANRQIETILSSISDGFYVLDPEWRFTYVSDRYCEMVGMPQSSLLGQNIWHLFPDAVNTDVYEQFQHAIREQTPLQFDYFYSPWNCWYEHRIYPSPTLTVVLSDITVRKQAELLLVEQKKLLELIALGRPLEECLFALCASVPKLNPNTRACFLLVDAQQAFKSAIAPDLPPSFAQGIKNTSIHDLCNDTANWRDLCRAHGILAYHSVPVLGNDNLPLGFFMLCCNAARTPSDWEVQLARFGAQVANIICKRDREKRWHDDVANYAPTIVLITDFTGYCSFLSQTWYDFSGLTEQTSLGFGWLDAVHPDDRGAAQTAFLDASKRGEAFHIEYRLRRQDGQYRWVINVANPSFGADGQLQGFISCVVDISDRRQIEAELQRKNQTLQTLLAASPLAIVVLDTNYTIQLWNPAAEQLFGWNEAEVLNQPLPIVPEEKLDECDRIRQGILHGDTFTNIETYRRKRDGSHIAVSISAAPFDEDSKGINKILLIYQDITESKQAEKALRESEERLRLATEGANLGMWYWDVANDTLTWTDRAKAMFGLPADTQMSMQVFLEAVHPDDRDRVQKVMNALQAGQIHTEVEYRTLWADGTVRWILAKGDCSHHKSGTLLAARGVLMDITALKHAEIEREQLLQREQALRSAAEAAESKLQEVLASIREDFVLFDRDWRIVYLNEQAATDLGMLREDALNKNMWELFPDLVGTPFYDRLHQVMRDRVPVQFEYYYPLWDRWFENRVYPTPDGIVNLCTNITERKRTEAELRQKNAILDVINELAPTPIFVKDRQGRIIYANPATLAVLNKSAAEVIGYRDRELYALPELGAIVTDNDQRIMESGKTEVVEESPDGVRTFLGIKVPYRNEAGEVIGLIGISNDITARVQLERDRERILQQEQAAREAAEKANRIKDEFLAVLSHELRSPLNPILGWTKLLQSGKLDANTTAQALATIERNAKLQTELIDDLLDVSRILQGKLTLNIRPIDLVSVVEAAIETVSLAATTKAIAIQTTCDANIEVAGDPNRLQQVVWNLVSNAVKFTPSGGQVAVCLTRVGTQAEIRVSDTGKGIASQFLPHVFDYFRQEDSATTRQFGGLGLGLAIVRHLVELHGGTVTADSPGEGRGATFTVRLPLSTATAPKAPQPSLFTTSEEQLTGIRVLVVDDDADMREVVSFVLKQSGAEVISVANATAALATLASFQPEILLSDIGMPEIDGYMLMRKVRALSPEQGGHILAIALTAYAAEFDQKQALQAGFQRHLTKPIEPDVLVKEIVQLLHDNRSQGSKIGDQS
ncbi:PAS domain S-box protein [Chroococcidiopsis sp. TS-821]|uniref:PAS domain S-box protein n=1 Tax=Chroococcidiopsis sp. TS-821 TaxID=1378066 RepID=UPI000CEF28ED|nr:PAS domain S-box protein [Chroococcidiopsis sp. TS-821]PPS40985.1 hypothetical protein B1A85_18940 [Chroococcidiopsis sp. TS-821]